MDRRTAIISRARASAQTVVLTDQCQRLVYTEQTDANGRKLAATYVPGDVMPCSFSWGGAGDTDRTGRTADRTTTTPILRVPLTATFTSRDRVRLTHTEGEVLNPALTFQIAGQPLPGLLTTVLELERVTT